MIIQHRVNTIEELKKTPREYGVEVDIRDFNGNLILNHEPFENGDKLEDFLEEFDHKFIVLEIKCEGIEKKVIEIAEKGGIENYFLLSVAYPSMLNLTRNGFKKMAVRFSEFEGLEMSKNMEGKVDWVWVDTFKKNPLCKSSYSSLGENFKICLVCPERWGRPGDVLKCAEYMKSRSIKIDAVMTDLPKIWEKHLYVFR